MSIRNDILADSPFFKLVLERNPSPFLDPDTLAIAIDGHLRCLPNLPAMDGFKSFHVLEETLTSLRVVGLAYLLPRGVLPLEADFRSREDGIFFRILVGEEDLFWKNLTEKKRWAEVHLYATEKRKPQWHWQPPVEGLLSSQHV